MLQTLVEKIAKSINIDFIRFLIAHGKPVFVIYVSFPVV